MNAKVIAVITPSEPWGYVPETPAERAAHSATVAIEDLDAAVWQAASREDVREVRAMVEELISRLMDTSAVALTRLEQWKEQ